MLAGHRPVRWRARRCELGGALGIGGAHAALPDGRGRQALAGRRPAFWERHVDFEDSKLWAGKFVRALASAGASGLPASSGHTTAPARGIWGDAPRSLLSGSRSAREDVGTRRGGPLPLSAPGPCPPASARSTRRPLALLPSGCPRGRAPLPPRRPAAEAARARGPHPGRCDLPPHGASHGDASARRWALSRGPAGRLRA